MPLDYDPPPPKPRNRKVIFIALGVLVAVAIIAYVITAGGPQGKYVGLVYGSIMIVAGGIEALLLLLLGTAKFFRTPPADEGYGDYFIAMGLVLVVGASLCFGGIYVMETLQ